MTTSYDPAQHYDHVTAAWARLLGDELHYGVFETGNEPLPVATNALTRRMIDAAQLAPGMDVLDVGCGSGAPACTLVADFGVRVLGITTSEEGVSAARRRAEDAGLGDTRFEVQDGTDNRQPDASFDRVWVLESSHLMRERERLIAECARVLRPGGRLVLCDLIRKREISFEEVRDRRADFATLRTAFGDAHMEPLEYYAATAERHGLEVDVMEDLTAQTLPTFDRWRANAEQHRAEATAAIGEEGVAAFERSTEILEAFWQDGTFGYGLLGCRVSRR
ncbi:MAG TPA: class I SAM-dependent methyltransferase [Acidimicrobiales bacterium]